MSRQPKYSPEDHARRGVELYDRAVRAQVEDTQSGRVVALDVDSGDYEVADGTLEAAERLLTRHPLAQIWFTRVGHRAMHRFGRAGTET